MVPVVDIVVRIREVVTVGLGNSFAVRKHARVALDYAVAHDHILDDKLWPIVSTRPVPDAHATAADIVESRVLDRIVGRGDS